MFIEVIVDPTKIIIEQPKENHYKSDMIGDNTTRTIKIKGRAGVDVRPETFDDRYSGRLNPKEKYDVVILLRTDYLGEEGKKKLTIVNE